MSYYMHCLYRSNMHVLVLQTGVSAAVIYWDSDNEVQQEPCWGSWEHLGCGGPMEAFSWHSRLPWGHRDVRRYPRHCVTWHV
jgi:hypothetical protein